MTAILEKTATYNASSVRSVLAALDGLSPIERFEGREKAKANAQRAWVRAGRKGINPVVFF